jgi:DNA polymerase-3 subunit delta'
LKFLEEPFDNTYAIFTTKNINNVLPTIKSRMNTYYLTNERTNLGELYIKYEINKEMQDVVEEIFLDGSEAITMIKNKKFIKLYNFAKNLLDNKKNVRVIKDSLLTFKKYEYQEIKLIIKIINSIVGKEKLNELIEKLSSSPNKTLVFNEI